MRFIKLDGGNGLRFLSTRCSKWISSQQVYTCPCFYVSVLVLRMTKEPSLRPTVKLLLKKKRVFAIGTGLLISNMHGREGVPCLSLGFMMRARSKRTIYETEARELRTMILASSMAPNPSSEERTRLHRQEPNFSFLRIYQRVQPAMRGVMLRFLEALRSVPEKLGYFILAFRS